MSNNYIESQTKLLGHFYTYQSSSWIIADAMCSPLYPEYFSLNDQIIIDDLDNEVAGICVDVEIILEDTEDNIKGVDIPVYGYYENNILISIFIEIESYIPTINIVDSTEYERLLNIKQTLEYRREIQGLTKRELGYISVTANGIFICDTDMIRLCEEYYDYTHTQIIVPPGTEIPGFRVGVLVDVSSQSNNNKIPVYGEYDGDIFKRIIIEEISG